ncbi:MAG TPA: hypothetical protein VEL76_43250 [Gemmataceae bacterium]|nr:hypothetical protein [Gemmataceae bacterium]
MAKKKTRHVNPEVLHALARTEIRARIGGGAVVWRYTVLVPVQETKQGAAPQPLATDADQDALEDTLATHFNGVTVLPEVPGFGLRKGRLEMNRSVPYVIYAAPLTASEEYFQALKKELQEALVQETILVERQDVWIL